MKGRDQSQLNQLFEELEPFPLDCGEVELIVIRPQIGKREEITEGQLSVQRGLIGDSWEFREGKYSYDGTLDPSNQITLVNSRIMELISPDKSQWKLAGDQFYVNLDLSVTNLVPGTKLQVGEAIIEISDRRHTAQKKFTNYFGQQVARFVNSELGRKHRFRGVKATILNDGKVKLNDKICKID